MYKYLIVGAGITGISFARLMQMKGIDSFIVLEAENEPGGLCRTKNIGGNQLDIGGGHFLCSKYKQVYDFIFSHISESEFNNFKRVSKILVDDEIIDFPFESNIWQLSIDKQIDYLLSVMNNGEALGKSVPENYRDWCYWKLGNKISNTYMIPYNEKIWGVSPEEMDLDWLHKIPELNLREILKASLIRQQDRSKMPSHSNFYYPKKGGFQEIFDAIFRPVSDKCVFNEPVLKLEYNGINWIINDKYEAEYVINTAPWPFLYSALGQPTELTEYFNKIKFNSIVVALYTKEYSHNWHWLYVPDQKKPYHREFYINNFAPHSEKNGLYTETNLKRWNDTNLSSDFTNPLYFHINEVAYPVPVIGHANAIKTILEYYRDKKLLGVGRWGQWQYLNADVCIYNVMQLVNSLAK